MSESRGTFTVSGSNITIIGGATLVFINPDTDVGFEVLRCWASQDSTETSEQQRFHLQTQASAFPTLTTATPVPHVFGETSRIVGATTGAVGTCGIDASAENAGAVTIIIPDSPSNLNGFLWIPTPKERIIMRPGDARGFGMRISTTPSTLTGWNFGVTYAEL